MSPRQAASVIFLVHGLLVSTWVSRIPDVQSSLALSPGVLGTVLLAIALGSLISMPLTGAVVARHGSHRATAWATYAFCTAVPSIALTGGPVSLGLALFFFGAAAGSMDVAMNAQGVTVERRLSRSIMSSLHALFSVGGMAGAFLGGQVARAGIAPATHFAACGLLCAVLTLIAVRRMIPDHVEAAGPMFALPRRPVLALGALGFCMLLSEGAIADWIAIFLRDAVNAGSGTAAAGYAVFSAAMAAGRFAGDSITDRFGPQAVVQWGCTVAAVSLTAALSTSMTTVALVALTFVGLGYAAIVPNVFTASARIPNLPAGLGIASVTTMGYFGFLAGPPAIGWLAEYSTLRFALYLLVALTAVSAILAPGAFRRPQTPPSPDSSAPARL